MNNWKRDPSGLTSGDLDSWHKKMEDLCPSPRAGDIVVTLDKDNKQVGYECLEPGYLDVRTRWARVSRDTVDGIVTLHDQGIRVDSTVVDSRVRRPMAEQAEDYTGDAHVESEGIYLSGGVYIDPDDAWF
ncbi:hypothetical protein VPHD148_0031 [Vibrio phage D148]